MNKYFLLDLDSGNHQYLKNSIFNCPISGMLLHDSPTEALHWRICDGSNVEKIESKNLPKVLRISGQTHLVQGYYRVETPVKQITGEYRSFVDFYAVCEW